MTGFEQNSGVLYGCITGFIVLNIGGSGTCFLSEDALHFSFDGEDTSFRESCELRIGVSAEKNGVILVGSFVLTGFVGGFSAVKELS